MLGFRAAVSLEQGLREFVTWWQAAKAATAAVVESHEHYDGVEDHSRRPALLR